MTKRAKTEAVDDGGAVLLLGAGIVGFLLWLRSKRMKAEALATQFQFRQMPVKPSPAPARKVEKQVSQWWNPAHSWHWRG